MSRNGEANGGGQLHFEGEDEPITKHAHWLAQKAVSDKFDHMDDKFDHMDAKFNRIETRLDDQYHDFNNNVQLCINK